MMTTNPLLDFSGLPRFDVVRPEHVTPAIGELLAENRALLARLETAPATWADFAAPFFDANERLSRAWGIVGHLHSVMDVPEWREAYNASLPEVTRFFAELGQNQRLFAQFKALRASPGYAGLSAAQRRIVEHEIRDFRLSGAELPEADKPRFQAIQEELASLQAKFSENLLDATNAFAEIVTDAAELAGIPADVIEAARAAAEKDGKQGWKFTLHMPSYLPVMQYAESRRLREALYRAYATRAAEFHDMGGKPEWDNMPLIRRILELRAEEAGHLGYANFAEVSLVPKMAESPADVLAFLRELAVKANAAREMQHGRIARELHEQIARDLGALAADLDWLRGHCSDHRPETEEKFAHLRSIAADAMEATRRIAADLRPHILDDLGLVAAIEFQIHAFRRSAGVACGFSFEPPDLRLDEPYPTTVYRIIQEALANVAKHARAAAVTIGVRRDRHELLVSIKDDGRGFDPSAPRSVTSFGLAGMHERTLLLGGVFTVASAPGAGTTVEARIPLDPAGR